MNEKLFISKIKVYHTPSEQAQANFSVGLSIASRLNGDEELVGSFDDQENHENPVHVGFITFREKFEQKEKAEEYRQEMSKKYRIGSTLNSRKWAWGREDAEATLELGNGGAVVHKIKYLNEEIPVPQGMISLKPEQMKYSGKVTEPTK